MLPRILLAVVAGVVLSLAFEPVALPWLAPVCVAGYVLSVRGTPPRRAWVPALAFGAAFYFTHIWWMRAVGTDAWIALSTVESLFYAALGPVVAVLLRARWWPLWVAAAWSTMEFIRSGWPFSGMPWGRLAYAVADTPAAPALAYVGATGVGFLVALTGALVAQAVVGSGEAAGPWLRRRGPALGLVAVCAVLAVPVLRPWQPQVTGSTTVAVVQGDVPGVGNDIPSVHRQVTRNHVEATIDLARDVASGEAPRPAFVLWPENSTAVDPFGDASTKDGIESAVRAVGVPVVVGGVVDAGPSHILNQGIVWDPDTGPGERYTKRHPVPYGEYVPFRDLLNGWNFGRLAQVSRDMVAGTGKEPITIAGIEVADAICFDIAYDDVLHDQVSRGAELVTVQTSNATFIHTDQIEQQFAITRLRAIETGRYVAVASTNGVSGVVAPDGSVQARAGVRTTSVLVEPVGLVEGLTPAVRMGSWPGTVLVVTSLIGLVFTRRVYGRRPLPAAAPVDDPAPEHRNETSLT